MDDKHRGKIKIKKSSMTSVLLMLWLSEIFALTIARYILSSFGLYEGFVRNFILTFVSSISLILFLLIMRDLKSSIYIPFFIIYMIVLLLLGITIVCHPEYKYFFVRENYGLNRVFRPDRAIYAYLFYSLVDNPKEILKVLKKFSYMNFVYLLIVELFPSLMRGYWVEINYLGQEVHREYSLSFGYSMLFPTIVLLYFFIKDKKIIALCCSLIGCVTIFLQGSRGALLMPVIFVGLMMISNIIESKNTSKKMLKIGIIIFLVVFICLFGNILVSNIVSFLESKGIQSRTLEAIFNGGFLNDSGRSIIWRAVGNAIREGGLFGYGFYGDRPFVYPYHYVAYSHNIFLELVCSFGIVGVLLSIYIIVGSIRMIATCKDCLWRELFIIFFSISCQLLLSLSIWYVAEFWTALAIAHKYFRMQKGNMKDI